MLSSWRHSGFHVFCGKHISPNNETAMENLVRYITIPTQPGEALLAEFLNPMGLTQRELADAIQAPHQRINDIVNGRTT